MVVMSTRAVHVTVLELLGGRGAHVNDLTIEAKALARPRMIAVEHGDSIVFMHAVAEGPANRSYGLQVAKLAGVPSTVVRRARDYLARLDRFSAGGGPQADLFAPIGVAPIKANELGSAARASEADTNALAAHLAALDPDAMTPRDALAALYELRKLLGRS